MHNSFFMGCSAVAVLLQISCLQASTSHRGRTTGFYTYLDHPVFYLRGLVLGLSNADPLSMGMEYGFRTSLDTCMYARSSVQYSKNILLFC